jgi:Cd2+/Zn2+-exporting ATPase
MRVVKENIGFAMGMKAMFLVAAMAGVATLWMAVAADMGATFIVTLNGLRLLRARRGE